MPSFFYTTMHPAMYHGHKARAPFFEGWYFKIVDQAEQHKYAIIPGIIKGKQEHSFVQVLDGVTGQTAYYSFPPGAFQASTHQFDLRIGDNHFETGGFNLALDKLPAEQQPGTLLPDNEPSVTDPNNHLCLRGELRFKGISPWPVRLAAPGIMGPYAWAPFMECYHGVVSLDHQIEGLLVVNGERVDFTGGRGYIEKDWGRSFPEAWVWFQSNHFAERGVCITASIAIIPWLWTSFNGFIIGLWLDRKLHTFATYTGAWVERLQVTEEVVEWVVRDRRLRLEMRATREGGGLLRGPTRLEMGKRVLETLTAHVQVRLSQIEGGILFEGTGRHAGLEVYDAHRLCQK